MRVWPFPPRPRPCHREICFVWCRIIREAHVAMNAIYDILDWEIWNRGVYLADFIAQFFDKGLEVFLCLSFKGIVSNDSLQYLRGSNVAYLKGAS